MISILRRIIINAVVCILVSASYTIAAENDPEVIKALRALYDDNHEFRTTMDQAFANIKVPDRMPCRTYDLSVKVRPWEFGSSPT